MRTGTGSGRDPTRALGSDATWRSGPNYLYSRPVHITPTAPFGPSPAPPAVPGLGPARRRVLTALLARPDGATIAELTAELGGHPNSVRLHLDGLTEVGEGVALVEAAPGRPTGRGRPAIRYRATAAARAVPAEDPAATDYRGLVSAFAEHLAGDVDDPRDTSRTIGQGWGRKLMAEQQPNAAVSRAASASSSARQEVVDLLGRLGFSPEPHPQRPATERLTTCPLLDVAQAHPEVVCQVHRGLVEGALATRDPDSAYEVDLEPFAEVGACRLRICSVDRTPRHTIDPDAG